MQKVKNNFREFPAPPSKYPFYYGWIILIVGTIGVLMSVPGQTVGVSVFTKPLMDLLRINEVQITFAYFLGTGISGFLITRIGKAYDKFGARIVALIAAVSLGCILFLFSKVGIINNWLIKSLGGNLGSINITLGLMVVLFLLLRLSGQGVTTMIARNMVMKWFDKNRGFANGIMGMATSFGFNISPVFFALLLSNFSMSVTYQILAIITGLIFSVIIFMFYRDNPWQYNLEPFEKPLLGFKQKILTTTTKEYNLNAARKTLIFWVFNLTLALSSLFVTAVFFLNELIFKTAGLSKEVAISIFPPIAVITLLVSLFFSWLSDFIKLRYLLHLLQLGFMFTAAGMFLLGDAPWAKLLMILGIGLGGGVFSILFSVSWPRFFGLKHLGAISGFAMSFTVVGSAIGPLSFSYISEKTGNYKFAGIICFILAAILFILSLRAKNPNEEELLAKKKNEK